MACAGSSGGLSMCAVGVAPLPLNMIPKNMVMGPTGPLGNIMDKMPIINIPSYGLCNSTPPIPKPCIPNVLSPWIPIPTVMINKFPAFDNTTKGVCTMGGVVQIIIPTQFNIIFG